MRDVAVVGFTQSKSVRRERERNETEILIPVIHELKKSLGIETKDIDFICSGSSDYLAGQSFAFVAGLDAVGAWHTVIYHSLWARQPEAVDAMPGGAAWRSRIESERPEGQRHLAVHDGHCTHVVDRDETIFDALGEDVAWVMGASPWVRVWEWVELQADVPSTRIGNRSVR